jgi:branched-subunit amino acid ABC-type transport system permease component
MKDLLPFLIVGITSGSLYGLAGLGLTLTYRTSGVFNFAHGALAAAGAYLFSTLHFDHGLAWPVALLISIAVVGVVAGVCLERLGGVFVAGGPATAIMGTVALLLLIQGLITLLYGSTTRSFPVFLPKGGFAIAGVRVEWYQLVSVVMAAAAAAALSGFLQWSATGRSIRAVVDNPELLDLCGARPERVRRMAWTIGSAFAALTGIMIASSLGLDAFLLTLLVVQAFGAAAIGRFSSLPGTYAGGLVVGVGASLLTKFGASHPALNGLTPNLPFLLLFVVLIVAPPRMRTALAGRTAPRRPPASPAKTRAGRTGRHAPLAPAALLVVVVALPWLVGVKLPVYTQGLILAVVFLSLNLLVWQSGQISLAHAAFAAVGAAAFSHLTVGAGLPWMVALAGAGLATVPLGVLVAVPSIRVAGVYLALATFGLGILLERFAYTKAVMFGATGFRAASLPVIGHRAISDKAFYYLCLAVLVVCMAGVAVLIRTRLGRYLRALGDDPVALSSFGLNVNTTRVLVFSLSAAVAGIGGALTIALAGQTGGRAFTSGHSLLWIAAVALAGRGLLSGPVIAAALVSVVPSYLPSDLVQHQPLIFGVATLVLLIGREHSWIQPGPRTLTRRAASPVRNRFLERSLRPVGEPA